MLPPLPEGPNLKLVSPIRNLVAGVGGSTRRRRNLFATL